MNQGYLVDDINPENIRNIKVIKGIERLLFGSGAIGGVIQIDESDASVSESNRAYLGYSSNNRGKTAGLVMNLHRDRLGIRFSGRRNDAENFRFPGGETSLNSAFDQNNLALSAYLSNVDGTTQSTWNHHYSDGLLERPQGFQNNPFELRSFRNAFTYQTDLKIKTKLSEVSNLEQRVWGLFLKTDQIRKNYNATFETLNNLMTRGYNKQAVGYKVNWHYSLNQRWKIRTGADVIGSWLEEQSSEQNFLTNMSNSGITANRIEKMIGLFTMAKYRLRNINFGAAIRGDLARIGDKDERLNFHALTGGLEFEWTASPKFRNSISFSRQFRYPSQAEAVGVVFGGRGTFFGNPEIKPEFSYQAEWNFIGYYGQWEYYLESWFALFDNRITEVYLGGNEYTYENIDKARTYGLEGRITRQWSGLSGQDELKTSLSGSFIRGDELDNEGILSEGSPLIGIPSARLRLALGYKKIFTEKLSIASSLNLDRVSALNRLPDGLIPQTWGVIQTEPYWLVEIKLEATRHLGDNQLSVGFLITNLTNTNYFPFGARIMGMGRNISSFMRYSF